MIKQLFLPEKIGNRLLFGKRVVGIDINRTHIWAAQVYLQGTRTTLEAIHEVAIEGTQPSEDNIVTALEKLKSLLPSGYELHTALHSNQVIFKELTLPFTSREKIALIIGYEVEPLLPFALADAIIDFVITKEFPEQKSVQVVVACTQKQNVAQHLALFERAGLQPDFITVDVIGMYGLIQQLPHQQDNLVLIDLGAQSTRTAYMPHAQLRMVRVLPQGIANAIKTIAEQQNISTHDAYDSLLRFGIAPTDQSVPAQDQSKNFDALTNALQFTLKSYTSTVAGAEPINRIVIYGSGSRIPNIASFIEQRTGITTQLFTIDTLFQGTALRSKVTTIPIEALGAVATAITIPLNEEFNLRKGPFARIQEYTTYINLAVALVLTIILYALLLTHYFVQTNKLKKELASSQEEVVEILKEQFPKIPRDEENIEDIIELANQEIERARETWFAFSYANQSRFLQYLLELTNKIDKQSLGFEPEKITIVEGSLILKATVKDFPSLKILERELRTSPLFKEVEPQDTPDFTMQIRLAPTSEDLT